MCLNQKKIYMVQLFLIDHTRKKHKVRWCDDFHAFNGIPFLILGTKVLDCQHGKDRKDKFKEKAKLARTTTDVRKLFVFVELMQSEKYTSCNH